jgi:hypothetical protein
MAYVKNYPAGWADLPAETTPITAATLDNIETQYAEAVATAAADVDSDIATHAALTAVHGAADVADKLDIAVDANLSAAAQAAIAASHTQGTDTTLGTVTANINMGTKKITNAGNPSDNQDLATKYYVDNVVAGGIPAGIIAMWGGLVANIPAGWYLCDGTNGTPNLADKFIKGTTSNPGATGGAATHTHDSHPSLSHTGMAVGNHSSLSHTGCSVASHGTLSHTGGSVDTKTGSTGAPSAVVDVEKLTPGGDAESVAAPAHTHTYNHYHTFTQPYSHGTLTHTVTQASAHTISAHSVTQATAHSSQSHSSASNEPAYYALCFIQKS